jgi:RimJ/RimL family protein N-acetyltransferase
MRFRQIESTRVILRRFRHADLPVFLAYRNDPEVARYQSWSYYSERDAYTLIEEMQYLEPGTPGEWFQFAIESKANGTLLGDCTLLIHKDEPHLGEIGYTLARAQQGQGYATEAIRALLDYAFQSLNLHRVIAQLDTRNDRSAALVTRLGFRREGHFRQNHWFKGAWTDEYLYAMLQEEWRNRDKVTG